MTTTRSCKLNGRTDMSDAVHRDIRLPRTLDDALAELASQNGVSVNQLIRELLEKSVEGSNDLHR
jgi:predicted HicB family RNase H-like nuclease